MKKLNEKQKQNNKIIKRLNKILHKDTIKAIINAPFSIPWPVGE